MNPLLLSAFGLALLGTILGYLLGVKRALLVTAVLAALAGAFSLMSGGAAALGFAMILAYALPVLVIPGLAGVSSGNFIRTGRYVAAALMWAPLPFLVAWEQTTSVGSKEEAQLAANFVEQEPRILKLAAGPIRVRHSIATTFSDPTRARYEFDFPGKSSHYIIVEVSRTKGKSEFRLSCVTTLSMGQRDGDGEPCRKGAIVLPSPP